MVIKLVKNEIKETFRTFLPVFILSIIGSILTFFVTLRIKNTSSTIIAEDSQLASVLLGMAMFAIMILVIATVVLTTIQLVKVAYVSLYKTNGYRVFTYPVSSVQLYSSKVLTMVFWGLVSSIVMLICYLLPLYVVFNDFFLIEELAIVWGMIKTLLLGDSDQIISTILLVISQVSTTILQISILMFAGSLANSSYVRKNRGFMAFLFFLGIYMIFTFVNGMIVPPSPTFEEVIYGNSGILKPTSILLSVLTDTLFFVCCSAGTIWVWNNKLEVLN